MVRKYFLSETSNISNSTLHIVAQTCCDHQSIGLLIDIRDGRQIGNWRQQENLREKRLAQHAIQRSYSMPIRPHLVVLCLRLVDPAHELCEAQELRLSGMRSYELIPSFDGMCYNATSQLPYRLLRCRNVHPQGMDAAW